ncbi:hypothetical protein ACFQ51_42740 [Streptomyces kaempferi]
MASPRPAHRPRVLRRRPPGRHRRAGHRRREPAPEALRRLSRDILDHSGHLTDDATILLAEWHPLRTPD